MLAKDQLSSCNVLLVANNARLLVGIEEGAKAVVVAAVPQDIERDSAFALIVRGLDVLLVEEEHQVLFGESEDALVRELLDFSIVTEQRCVDLLLLSGLHYN